MRRHLTRDQRLVISAAAVGLLLAAGHGHGHGHAAAAGHGGISQATGATLTSADSNVALGRQLASAYGWGSGAEWTCLDELWTRESGWRMVWNYQGSGAYGIPQALPASKMAAAGADYMTNPATQIRWGLGYIQGRYGDPCTAWAHETAANWY
jgi:resuscitation-promoting factor RpfB